MFPVTEDFSRLVVDAPWKEAVVEKGMDSTVVSNDVPPNKTCLGKAHSIYCHKSPQQKGQSETQDSCHRELPSPENLSKQVTCFSSTQGKGEGKLKGIILILLREN